jgi:hypothetical protein
MSAESNTHRGQGDESPTSFKLFVRVSLHRFSPTCLQVFGAGRGCELAEGAAIRTRLARDDGRAPGWSAIEGRFLAQLIEQRAGFFEVGVFLQGAFDEDDGARAIFCPVGDAGLAQIRQGQDLPVFDWIGGDHAQGA